MPKNKSKDLGLAITNNSKTGPAFSLPRSRTCINKTEICARVCYGRGIRYQSTAQKEKRERNYRTVQFLLKNGGPELLAENLALLVDQARPIDWIAARISGRPTNIPWTFRIHDVGDAFSVEYVQAWINTVKIRRECGFWFYTRSFLDKKIFEALTELAQQPNCKGWLSLDSDNYESGIISYCSAKADVWNLALLQEEAEDMPDEFIEQVTAKAEAGRVITFPKHHAGRHVEPIENEKLTICPQILGAYKLEASAGKSRPCQSCSYCLP